MEMFGVGRKTICEDVQELVSRGILDVRPGRRTTVEKMNSRELLDLAVFSALLADSASMTSTTFGRWWRSRHCSRC
jgi:DNA-binding FadR family transcriptional regulator